MGRLNRLSTVSSQLPSGHMFAPGPLPLESWASEFPNTVSYAADTRLCGPVCSPTARCSFGSEPCKGQYGEGGREETVGGQQGASPYVTDSTRCGRGACAHSPYHGGWFSTRWRPPPGQAGDRQAAGPRASGSVHLERWCRSVPHQRWMMRPEPTGRRAHAGDPPAGPLRAIQSYRHGLALRRCAAAAWGRRRHLPVRTTPLAAPEQGYRKAR